MSRSFCSLPLWGLLYFSSESSKWYRMTNIFLHMSVWTCNNCCKCDFLCLNSKDTLFYSNQRILFLILHFFFCLMLNYKRHQTEKGTSCGPSGRQKFSFFSTKKTSRNEEKKWSERDKWCHHRKTVSIWTLHEWMFSKHHDMHQNHQLVILENRVLFCILRSIHRYLTHFLENGNKLWPTSCPEIWNENLTKNVPHIPWTMMLICIWTARLK